MVFCKTHIAVMTRERTPKPARRVRKAARTGAGRPEKPDAERLELVPIRFPRPMLEAVDDLARADIEGPTRSVMIRRLLAEAIAARKGKP